MNSLQKQVLRQIEKWNIGILDKMYEGYIFIMDNADSNPTWMEHSAHSLNKIYNYIKGPAKGSMTLYDKHGHDKFIEEAKHLNYMFSEISLFKMTSDKYRYIENCIKFDELLLELFNFTHASHDRAIALKKITR